MQKVLSIVKSVAFALLPAVISCEESLNEMHLAGRDEPCWQVNQECQDKRTKGETKAAHPKKTHKMADTSIPFFLNTIHHIFYLFDRFGFKKNHLIRISF